MSNSHLPGSLKETLPILRIKIVAIRRYLLMPLVDVVPRLGSIGHFLQLHQRHKPNHHLLVLPLLLRLPHILGLVELVE